MQIKKIIVDEISYMFLEDQDAENITYQIAETGIVIGYARADMMDAGTTISAYFDTSGPNPQPPIFMERKSSVEHESSDLAHEFTIRTLVTMHQARLLRDTINTQGLALFLPYCEGCGGTDINAEATARWNRENQQWEFECHKSYYCIDCNNSTVERDRFTQ